MSVIPYRTPLILRVNKGPDFPAGIEVIALYKNKALGYRCCINYRDADYSSYNRLRLTRCWVQPQDLVGFVDTPDDSCSCGSQEFIVEQNIKECTNCGNIFAAGRVIKNDVATIPKPRRTMYEGGAVGGNN